MYAHHTVDLTGGKMKKVVLLLTCICALFAGSVTKAHAATTCTSGHAVRYVVDGDTIRLTNGRYVRMIGYDTPERGERYFDKATTLLNNKIYLHGTGSVRLCKVSGRENTDYYGRLLRYVRVGKWDAGKAEIRSGYGHARYDSRDGYQWHPLEAMYRHLDAVTRNLWSY